MKRPTRLISIILTLIALMSVSLAFGDEYSSDRGFSIDLPEGFQYLDGDGSTTFTFGSPDGVVEVYILIYPQARFSTAASGADELARKLSGRGSFTPLSYAGLGAAIGEMNFAINAEAMRGIGFFMNDATAPLGADGKPVSSPFDIAVIACAPVAAYERYRDLIASAVDGFSANYSSRTMPGPLGAKARAALGIPKPKQAAIRFGAASISSYWDPREAAISQELVEREYRVLSAYGDSPELIDAAVARFYRVIYRDASPALDRLALEMSKAWETGAWSGTRRPAELTAVEAAPTATPSVAKPMRTAAAPIADTAGAPRFGATADPRGYAEALLSWVQGYRYERDPSGSDVVNPISAAFEGRGDCDSRALVMAMLLGRENIESALMVSLVHEHAMLAVDAPGMGARYPFAGKKWLVAETTAQVGIGQIAADMADPADWIGVAFPR